MMGCCMVKNIVFSDKTSTFAGALIMINQLNQCYYDESHAVTIFVAGRTDAACSSRCSYIRSDVNSDGTVNITDFLKDFF